MRKEEQGGVPPVDVMRQVLDENRALVRLLCSDTANRQVSGGDGGRATMDNAASANALISAYQELLILLEILSATSSTETAQSSPELGMYGDVDDK